MCCLLYIFYSQYSACKRTPTFCYSLPSRQCDIVEQLIVRVNAAGDVTARVTHVTGYWGGRAELWLVFDNELRSWVASAPTRYYMYRLSTGNRLIKKFPFSGSRRWESAAYGLILGKVKTRVKCQRSCCQLGTPTTSHSDQFAVLKRMLFECSRLTEKAV